MTLDDQIQRHLKQAMPTKDRHVAWLIDVDDTIIDTHSMHHRAAKELTSVLTPYLKEDLAKSAANRFSEVFDDLILAHQQGPTTTATKPQSTVELEARIENFQKEITDTWHVTRLFSREILLRIAIEDCGAKLDSKALRRCADEYWKYMLENPILFPDAIRLFQMLSQYRVPTYLMTSSDARYHEKSNGQFSYTPNESLQDKLKRISALQKHGVAYSAAFIGDPNDKPTERFFNRALIDISSSTGYPLESLNIVAVGDSYKSDIQTPMALHNRTLGILYQRNQPAVQVEVKGVISVGNFDILTGALTQSNT